MITSIVVKDRYNIGLNSSGKFRVGDVDVNIKEVPFVRYRFDYIAQGDIEYIKGMMEKFKYSGHLMEFRLDQNTAAHYNWLMPNFDNLASFLYIDVYDANVESLAFGEDVITFAREASNLFFDGVMLKDRSTTLHTVAAFKLKQVIAEAMGIKEKDIGICGPALSHNGEACMTAVKARELLTEYSDNDQCALPTANHESMNRCGCIRYMVVDSDTVAPASKNKGGGGKKTSKKKSGDSKRSKNAVTAWI